MKLPTYTARYTGHPQINGDLAGKVIYQGQPAGNLIGALPIGSFPIKDNASTLERIDGGDVFEHAVFHTPSGCVLTITRDPGEVELEVVIEVDFTDGKVAVLSNCETLNARILVIDDPDTDRNTDHAEARLARERLHLIEEHYG